MALCLTKNLLDASDVSFAVPYVPPNLLRKEIVLSASGDSTLVSGTGGQTIKIYKLFVRVNAAMTLKLKDGASYIPETVWPLDQYGAIDLQGPTAYAHYECGTGNALAINSDTAAAFLGWLYYLKS